MIIEYEIRKISQQLQLFTLLESEYLLGTRCKIYKLCFMKHITLSKGFGCTYSRVNTADDFFRTIIGF